MGNVRPWWRPVCREIFRFQFDLPPWCKLPILSLALSRTVPRLCKISQLKSFSRKGNQQPLFTAEKPCSDLGRAAGAQQGPEGLLVLVFSRDRECRPLLSSCPPSGAQQGTPGARWPGTLVPPQPPASGWPHPGLQTFLSPSSASWNRWDEQKSLELTVIAPGVWQAIGKRIGEEVRVRGGSTGRRRGRSTAHGSMSHG